MKKKGLFTGWRDVFSFTAVQNVKGTGYKASTLLLGIVIAVAFSLISILMAVFQDGDDSSDNPEDIGMEAGFGTEISEIYLVDNDILSDGNIKNLVLVSMSLEGMSDKTFDVSLIDESKKDECIRENDDAITVELSKTDDKNLVFNTYLSDNTKLRDVAEEYINYVISYIDVCGYGMAGVSAENMIYFTAPHYAQASSVNDSVENMGVMMTEMLVPMIFSLLMYSMILMHGQSITKSVVAEKSSKLMEMILTSVKPYALISGKILAVALMAIGQILFWIVCGYAGYQIGGIIAENINPDYINYADLIIDMMSIENGSGAFTIGAAVIAVAVLMIGFIMYCVLAGLVSASVSKMEDISTAMSVFQIPVIVGWLVAYFSSFANNEALLTAIHLIPVTSPFILPADIILGKCGIIEGIGSLALLVVSTVVLILITGKVYKGKIFNRS